MHQIYEHHVSAQALGQNVRPMLPTLPRRADVVVVVDGLEALDTGALAGLLQVYGLLCTRGAARVRFNVGAAVAAELRRVGLAHLVASATLSAAARRAA